MPVVFGSLRISAQSITAPHCYTAEYNALWLSQHPEEQSSNREALRRLERNIAEKNTDSLSDTIVYTVPVVVHVVYNTSSENISDDQVFSEIDVLDEDYRRLNTDTSDTPDAFQSIASDVRIQFCLAAFDPDGNPTDGITRTQTDITEWSLDKIQNVTLTDSGGMDAWNPDHYLNLWVCDMASGFLGISSVPGTSGAWDGCIINYLSFGRVGLIQYPYNLGRTATHEVGHWLGLAHTWGDDGGSCGGSDGIDDTPNQADNTFGCPSFPLTDDCTPDSPGVMFMDYMDYTDDACMNMFTADQVIRMRTVLETMRGSILSSAAGCSYSGGGSKPVESHVPSVLVYPDPNTGEFNCTVSNFDAGTIHIVIFNTLGQTIREYTSEDMDFHITIKEFAAGNYFIKVYNNASEATCEFLMSH